MANISLKKDYMDGNVLYGKDLNPNFELLETTINANDNSQSATNIEVQETLTQLSSDMTQAKTDISTLENDISALGTTITNGDNNTLQAAKTYTDEKIDDIPTYTLPVASATVLGGVKIGENINVSSDGTISVENGGTGTNGKDYLIYTEVNVTAAIMTKGLTINFIQSHFNRTPVVGDVGLAMIRASDAAHVIKNYLATFSVDSIENGVSATILDFMLVDGVDGVDGTDGENGATFTPDVSDDGTLSWTNDKGLTNPDPVNIKGPQGGTGATGAAGADGADGLNYLIYSSNPVLEDNNTGTPQVNDECKVTDAYFNRPPEIGDECLAFYQYDTGYNTYILIIEITGVYDVTQHKGVVRKVLDVTGADGTDGQGVPTGGTEGQVLAKNSATDFDTVWKTIESGGGFTELVGTEEEPYDLSTGPDEPGIYLIKGYYKTNPSSSTTYNAQGGIFLFNTLWNFENRQEADQNIARIMMDTNHGFQVKINNKTKNSPSTNWTKYQLNPVNSTDESGNIKESMSTALFVNLTGINDYTNLSSLQTTDKSSLIAAINELKTRLDNLESQI